MKLWILTDGFEERSFLAGVYTTSEAAQKEMEFRRYGRQRDPAGAAMNPHQYGVLLYPSIVEVETDTFKVIQI